MYLGNPRDLYGGVPIDLATDQGGKFLQCGQGLVSGIAFGEPAQFIQNIVSEIVRWFSVQ